MAISKRTYKRKSSKKRTTKKKKSQKKRKVSPKSVAVLKALNKTASDLQRKAGTTTKTIKVNKLSRKEALKRAAKLYKKR